MRRVLLRNALSHHLDDCAPAATGKAEWRPQRTAMLAVATTGFAAGRGRHEVAKGARLSKSNCRIGQASGPCVRKQLNIKGFEVQIRFSFFAC
jgi:hypothetical protein